jgi:hypothetical protein
VDFLPTVYPALVLCPSCISERVGINQKLYSYHKQWVNTIECSQPKAIKTKTRQCKLRSGVNWKKV